MFDKIDWFSVLIYSLWIVFPTLYALLIFVTCYHTCPEGYTNEDFVRLHTTGTLTDDNAGTD